MAARFATRPMELVGHGLERFGLGRAEVDVVDVRAESRVGAKRRGGQAKVNDHHRLQADLANGLPKSPGAGARLYEGSSAISVVETSRPISIRVIARP